MITRDRVRPGVTVLVPETADLTRPRISYKLRIRAAYDSHRPGCVFVGGDLLRLDGTPTTRKHPYRVADLHLASIELVEAAAGVPCG
jgi:hypothetical protein